MDSGDFKLKSIFDLCSPDSEGFILTEFLADKLAEQFSDQALVTIQAALDPNRVGRLSFNQFCLAVAKLQSKNVLEEKQNPNILVNDDEDELSDPENTYNEYDIPEDEISEMESFEAIGESPHTLSPIKAPESSEFFHRHGSFRRSHRRARSWTNKLPVNDQKSFDVNFSNDETSSIASEYDDLSEKLDKLQGHVSKLEEEKTLQTQYESVKQENHQLTNRVNELEEKLQDMMERNQELKDMYQSKILDIQREHDLELQVLQSRIEVMTSDKERISSELIFTKTGAKETRESLASIQTQSELLTKQVMETNEEYRRLNKRFTAEQDKHNFECTQLQNEVSELKAQLKLAHEENVKLKSDISDAKFDPTSARIKAHVDNLKVENEELKRSNEELTDQLAQTLTNARMLMCNGDQSIAQELSSSSRDEVLEALRNQENINDQLRDYLDRITLSILERDPGILEIKS